jgi:hypothetical protein
MSGIYRVIMSADMADADKKLSALPSYPYMHIKKVPIRFVNSINQ